MWSINEHGSNTLLNITCQIKICKMSMLFVTICTVYTQKIINYGTANRGTNRTTVLINKI